MNTNKNSKISKKLRGFFDLQVNGYMGVDFSATDLKTEDFRMACRTLLSRGIAAFLPTMITASMDTYRRNLPIISAIMDEEEFAHCLPGIHLEGPFLSNEPGAIGAQNPQLTKKPAVDILDELIDICAGKLKMLTIAAELPGSEALTRHGTERGICISLGHHMAQHDDLQRLVAAGAKSLTHLGNGLPNLIDRHHNPIWEGLACDDLTATIISDGHHLPESMLRVFVRSKGVKRLVVISDAAPIAGMPAGQYETLGNRVVLEPSGLLHNPDKNCMVGSAANMMDCMNVLASLGEVDLDGMMQIGLYNPLELVGMSEADIRNEPLISYDTVVNRFELLS